MTQEMSFETVGDHSYIPLDQFKDIRPIHRHAGKILQIINTFEKVNPEWKVTGWRICYDNDAPWGVSGIFVDHVNRK